MDRRAVVVSDLHLGSINGVGFCRRVAAKASSLQPDIVFLPGDLFDGTKADIDRVIAPLKQLAPPLGIYFSTGNHEEFTDPAHYIEAIGRAGVRVLRDEVVDVDGMQVAGVYYHSSSSPLRMKAALDSMNLDRARPSILLNHAPTRLPTVEQAGFSLQLSGHTHGGQFLPFTWITRSIYGRLHNRTAPLRLASGLHLHRRRSLGPAHARRHAAGGGAHHICIAGSYLILELATQENRFESPQLLRQCRSGARIVSHQSFRARSAHEPAP